MASGKAVASGLRAAGFSVVEEEITSPDIALDSSVDLVLWLFMEVLEKMETFSNNY